VAVEISLSQLLESREARVREQERLLRAYPDGTLICLTVQFPGPVKRDISSILVGEAGITALEEAFQERLYEDVRDLETGFEAFYIVPESPEEAKRRCCEIEDTHPWGRLMDIDVILPAANPADNATPATLATPAGTPAAAAPLSRAALGLPERKCLLCDRPARECIRARTHSLTELQARIDALLSEQFR